MEPGLRCPLRATSLGGMSRTPVSEARTKSPSFLKVQRAGLRPFLSNAAPAVTPSVKAKAEGPSQGSISAEWYS